MGVSEEEEELEEKEKEKEEEVEVVRGEYVYSRASSSFVVRCVRAFRVCGGGALRVCCCMALECYARA